MVLCKKTIGFVHLKKNLILGESEVFIGQFTLPECKQKKDITWRKIVTVPAFIFRHFSLKTLTNINTLTTRPRDNVYLRRQNK